MGCSFLRLQVCDKARWEDVRPWLEHVAFVQRMYRINLIDRDSTE